ncbi:MAG: hypothetical protein EP343_19715 [Deltaproteobacteria bacterium]|nr:MAG: hypothetical protein EP343_19715 [Deltaproteobacteria bacterium]
MVRSYHLGGLLLVLWMFVSFACSSGTTPGDENPVGESVPQEGTSVVKDGSGDGPEPTPMPTQKEFGGDRPVKISLPFRYDPSVPLPLVVVLHGAGANGDIQTLYFGFTDLQQTKKFLMIAPNGIQSKNAGVNVWNATDACCDLDGIKTDDLGYIKSLIDEVKSVYKVDEKRVFLVGHSNGGFLSYRIACDASNYVSGIAVLAGATFNDKSRCKPSQPVNILHVHGTKDDVIYYNGANVPRMNKPQPGAERSVNMWGEYNGCTGARKPTGTKLDLIVDLEGSETVVEAFEGCPKGGAVELWTIQEADHIPTLAPSYATTVWDWLIKNVKE